MKMVQDKPILGIGLGLYKPVVGKYLHLSDFGLMAHNTYVEIPAELGIPALLIYLWVIWATYRSLSRTRKAAKQLGDDFIYNTALGLQAGFVGFVVGAFFLSAEYHKPFWFYVFITIPLERLVRERLVPPEATASVSKSVPRSLRSTAPAKAWGGAV